MKPAAIALGVITFSLGACSDGDAGRNPVPEASIDLKVQTFPELETTLASLRGKPAIVNIWATWCPPCVAELPDLVATAHEYGPKGVTFLGISYDLLDRRKDREKVTISVRRFLAARGLDLPVVILDADDSDAVTRKFGLSEFVPYTLAFDKDGTIVDRQEGNTNRERFSAMAERLLSH